LWLIETEVFQMPQLHKHFNVSGYALTAQLSVNYLQEINRKMKKNLLLFFITALCNILAAQNAQIDSLKNVLQAQKEDTNKINTLNNLSRLFMYEDALSAFQYANQALSLSENINFKKGKVISYIHLASSFYQQGNYADALKNFYSALIIAEPPYEHHR